jgi:PAS domain S-box-containing protein
MSMAQFFPCCTVNRRMRLIDRHRIVLFRSTLARYAFGFGMVVVALALRLLVSPLTGKGAPFALFLGATLVTSLVAGIGPAILTLLISIPVAVGVFVLPAGYPVSQAVSQALLFALDGVIVIYLAFLMIRDRRQRRDTVELAPDAYLLADLNARFTDVNQAACRLLGYEREELIGKTIFDIIPPEDFERLKAVRTELLVPGTVSKSEWALRRKDGTFVPIEASANILKGGRWQAFIRDVTRRRRVAQERERLLAQEKLAREQAEVANAKLRESEAKFSGIVSIAAEAISSVDSAQRIMIFNEGAEEIFGYNKDEALGMPLERLIPERFRAAHASHFAGFVTGQDTTRDMHGRRELFGLRKNGEEFPAEASISKVGLNGSTIFSVVLRDVTDRKEVEQALQRALAARDDVLRIVAHDLRNPLNTIIMQSSLLEREGPEPERRDQKPRLVLQRSAKRMNLLIQDLLDVSAIEAGQLKVERAPTSAGDLAREAVEAQSLLAASSELELRLELEPDIPDVLCDRKRLLQVFENLMGNALKFTPKGGCITVSAAAKDGEVQFAVADTGPGIAPESVPHVFDRFWQAATRERQLGAGLGLPITKGIVEAHGGQIWLESTVGRGTTFFFTIPVAPPKGGVSTHGDAQTRRQSPRGSNVGRPRRERAV